MEESTNEERPTSIEFNNALVAYKGKNKFLEMLAINVYETVQLGQTIYHQTAQDIAQNLRQ